VAVQEPSLQGQCCLQLLYHLKPRVGLRCQGSCLLGSWICRLRALRGHGACVTRYTGWQETLAELASHLGGMAGATRWHGRSHVPHGDGM
jgi:hypothetical protein